MSNISIAGTGGGGGGGRTVLSADTNYYIATTGNDANPGTIGSPWRTLQHAFDFIAASIDLAGFQVFINLANGSYAGAVIPTFYSSKASGPTGSSPVVGPSTGPFVDIRGNSADATLVSLTQLVSLPLVWGQVLSSNFNSTGVPVGITNLTIDGTAITADLALVALTGPGTLCLNLRNVGVATVIFKGCTVVSQSAGDCLSTWDEDANIIGLGTIICNGGHVDFISTNFAGVTQFWGVAFKFQNTPVFDGAFVSVGIIAPGDFAPQPASTAFETGCTFSGALSAIKFNIVGPLTLLDFSQIGDQNSLPGAGWISQGNASFAYTDTHGHYHIITGDLDNTGTGATFNSVRDFTAARSSGLPTTSDLLGQTWNLYKDTVGGGVLLMYNDAGTMKSLTRWVLHANLNLYVSVTGSDSNNGFTSGSAWATLQHAMSFIASNIDTAGFTITVNIGAGTFVGVGGETVTGGGLVAFIGAGSGSTTIGIGDSDGVFNFGECFTINALSSCAWLINAVTFAPDATLGDGIAIAIYFPFQYFALGAGAINSGTADIIFDCTNAAGADIILMTAPSNIIAGEHGSIGIKSGGTTINSFIHADEGGILQSVVASYTLLDNLTVSTAFFIASATSRFVDFGGSTFSLGGHTCTGPRFDITGSSAAASETGAGALGPNFFPGSIAGTTDASSSYDGIPGSNDNYQTPTTGFSITFNNTDTDLILDPSGTLATGTITMPAAPINGQKVTIRSSHIITTLTVSPNTGQSISAPPTTLAAGGTANAIYRAANTTWYF